LDDSSRNRMSKKQTNADHSLPTTHDGRADAVKVESGGSGKEPGKGLGSEQQEARTCRVCGTIFLATFDARPADSSAGDSSRHSGSLVLLKQRQRATTGWSCGNIYVESISAICRSADESIDT